MKAVNRGKKLKTIVICALILVVFIGNFLFDVSEAPKTVRNKLTDNGNDTVGELHRRLTIEQEVPYHAGDCGVSIRFGTYARRNLGNVHIKVEGEKSGFVYAHQMEPVYAIKDNQFMDVRFAEDCPQEDETLRITITSTSREGHSVTVFKTDKDVLPDYALTINGKEADADLVVQTFSTSHRMRFAWPIFALCVVVLVVCMIMAFSKRFRLQNKYLAVALSLGLIYIFVMTPLSLPDEQIHYQAAFRLSNALSFQWDDLSKGDSRYFDYHGLTGHYNTGNGYDRICDELFSSLDDTQGEIVSIWGNIGYPLMRIPQTIGLLIGRLLRTNFLITFYLGRLTNLLFFILCVYSAIRIAPRFKLLFFMVGIMPMALHQAASYSYDNYINAMSILLFAFFLRVMDKKGSIRFRDTIPIAVIGALLAPAKGIYISLLLIMFAIPARRYVGKKQYWMSMVVVICSALLVVGLFHIKVLFSMSSSSGEPSMNWEDGYNYTIADFLQRPQEMKRVLYLSFRTMIWEWFEQAKGRVMSGQSMILNQWILSIYGMLLLMSSFSFKGEKSLQSRERLVFAVTSLIPVCLLILIMLVSWTSNTHEIVQGVQGRYFVPCIPLLFMCMNNRLVRIKRPIDAYIITAGGFINVCAMQYALFTSLLQ